MLFCLLKDFKPRYVFFTTNKLTAVRFSPTEIAIVGNGAENVTISKSSGSSAGSINKKTVSSTKDIFALKYLIW